jgi:two-component system cell cycle sensor histidine kinase/response regulator CckA
MSTTDPTEPLESARRANRALAERVAELERQLKRFADGGQAGVPLGRTLSEREALLAEVERIMHIGSWVWNVVTDEVLWSDELYRILGLDPAVDRASVARFFEHVHPEDQQRVRDASVRSVQSGINERIEYRVLRPDGSVRHVTTDEALLFDANGDLQRAVGVVLDVTEARESALALKRTAELLAEAQRIGKMGSFEVKLADQRMTCSDEMYRVMDMDIDMDMDAGSDTPRTFEQFIQRLHDDDRERVRYLVERLRQRNITEPSRARLVHRDGSIHHIDMMAIATRDKHGELEAIRGTVADVSELVRLEAQFHQSQKMEAVGQLAGGLAHDYNNLLMVISGNAELLADQRDCLELREILAAASTARTLTSRLLTFSRRTPQRARVAQLKSDVEESTGLIDRALGDRIVAHYAFEENAWPVRVDHGQIQQILLNLALNARDAMPEGGTLTFSIRNETLDPEHAELRDERPGEYVTLTVTDTGIGMDPATQARVFEPFFTTKPPGRGTGLGLAMVFGSMKQSGGFIKVKSQPRMGSSFTLWFPRASEEPTRSAPPGTAPPRARARVLLVEDNPAVAAVAKRILESAGYAVRVREDPREALQVWQAEPADVLVTDVEMPGMSGIQLRERLCQTTPDLRTLFITGHSSEPLDVFAQDKGSAVVMKPFSRNELLAALAQLLGQR